MPESTHALPILFIVGLFMLFSYAAGRLLVRIKLPAVIGFMLLGVAFGPSWLNLVNYEDQSRLGFLTEVTLGVVAVTIGLELKMSTLKRLGVGIVSVIIAESTLAFLFAGGLVLWATNGDWITSLIFGAMAPASAPAGTVAVIQEYKTKGPLTNALYAIVGFDDGLAIIIFGFAAAIGRSMLETAGGGSADGGMMALLLAPLREIGLSLLVGAVLGVLFCMIVRFVKDTRDQLIVMLAFIFIANGLSEMWHLSLILTNMVIGMVMSNTQPIKLVEGLGKPISTVMPLLYLLFFTLAGCNLEVSALKALGWVGAAYIVGRTVGKVLGCRWGAKIGTLPESIKNHAGLAILSQAGVAIGLALIVKQEFKGLGPLISDGVYLGDQLGTNIITSVTATSIFFGIIGPLLTKRSLEKSGEIPEAL